MRFKPGDVVWLKSSREPQMTVAEIDATNAQSCPVRCQWFDGRRLMSEWFAEASLEDEESFQNSEFKG